MSTLILIDGSSILYRAYYVFPLLINSRGEPTGAIFGFINILNNIIKKYNPSHMAVVFDSSSKNFRHEIFQYYKCNRLPMPNNLRIQVQPLCEIIQAIGLKIITLNGVEADDVIGTLSYNINKSDDFLTLISTNDKDMAQLVTSKVNLINTDSKKILGPDEVKKKYGVSPKLIADLLAITGDSSDNIPGIPKIGKKTAVILLNEIGGIKYIYSNLNKVACLSFRGAKSTILKLQKYREIALLSYKLAKIKTDVLVDLNHKDLVINNPNIIKLKKFFYRYEFKNFFELFIKINNKNKL
ncbi:hypothetical protein CRV09_02670 [Candidatus Pantoea edessiphila]|uniref:5'-3' exonuclease domain-containing protein n=1 Tax=Candidatus Pantoea edessiphila TaxID=2044610 RepID=A0A2P5T1F1_9GAMM|nr:5'-3' exonuclease H3TH domain-containing protein [Candidatus Pantoea edessiphila]PPI88429.1 hypothetical protein CRV09_02670 [Candidatus Pantoea edessiphila]